jgi:serine/threonine protein kinase
MANEGRGSYDKRCDFWSLGITLFELLFLDPPFYADSLVATYNQIMNHKSYFALPDDVKVDQNTEDLLRKYHL